MTRRLLPLFLFGGWLMCGTAVVAEDKTELATQTQRFFGQFCHRCHRGEGSESGYDFDVLKIGTLTATRGDGETGYVVPGKPNESPLFRIANKGRMPPRNNPGLPRPSAADIEILKQWITAGALDFPKIEGRPFVGLEAVLTAIRDDLNKASSNDRPYLRYFTLTHLHNNPSVSADHLRLTRAALSKALNSLSWNQDVTVPRLVDAAETVLAIDIRKLGWGRDHWRKVLEYYPYGVQYGNHPNEKLKNLDEDIQRQMGDVEELVHARADWFVATATRPPLYHALLYEKYLPALKKRPSDANNKANPKRMMARDLEDHLHVSVIANLLASDPPARRAGFARSGVSGQNRMIERHPLKAQGAYWKSYDFKASTWEANLQQFPLGPRFDGNPFNTQAFVHDGGEIIFHLPNGLQGYLLVNGKDERLDAGPIEVVSDALKTSGTPAIVNGLSCMACHKHGTLEPPRDLVREGAGVFSKARERVKLLYAKQGEMERLVRRDSDQFLRVLQDAVGPFLDAGADKDRPLKELPEPIGDVARMYLLQDLDVVTAARELYMEDEMRLRLRIEDSDDLKKLGLGALVKEGGTIKRGAWESIRGTSQMQQAARELGFTPVGISHGR